MPIKRDLSPKQKLSLDLGGMKASFLIIFHVTWVLSVMILAAQWSPLTTLSLEAKCLWFPSAVAAQPGPAARNWSQCTLGKDGHSGLVQTSLSGSSLLLESAADPPLLGIKC